MSKSNMNKGIEEFWENAEKFSDKIGLDKITLHNLLAESDDWTFIAKVHFVTESALKKMLHEAIDNPALEEEIFSMPFKSVAAWCKKLKVIDHDLVPVVKYIQGLRNKLLHNPGNLTFSLEKHVRQEKGAEYYSVFHPYLSKLVKIKEHAIPRKEFMLDNPRIAIFFAVINLLGVGQIGSETISFKRKNQKIIAFKEELREVLKTIKDN